MHVSLCNEDDAFIIKSYSSSFFVVVMFASMFSAMLTEYNTCIPYEHIISHSLIPRHNVVFTVKNHEIGGILLQPLIAGVDGILVETLYSCCVSLVCRGT